jgi:hypothetical protein
VRRPGEIGASAGIPTVDLAPLLAATARRPGEGASSAAELYLLGRFHLGDEGHRVAAEGILRFLTQGTGRGLLEPR